MLRCLFGPQHSHGGPNRGPIPLLASTWMLFKGICASYLLHRDARLVEFRAPPGNPATAADRFAVPVFPEGYIGISFAFCDVSKKFDCYCKPASVWEASDSRSAWCPLVALLLLLIGGHVRPTHALSRAAIWSQGYRWCVHAWLFCWIMD